ncbi:doxx family protein [Aestuariibaculum marinum]|uniref:Doxx family protein n=1 Tax=Aestuariibaculum marinum TaxID=2683592 RepID=A0A8J6QEC9_9FLAO|nr:doxx family protein [Aestuariibaculum marinum]MBD0825441.1 doxx family protein [Aestuariibaculum marinum]
MLGISIGLIYIWFGSLKFFPGVSPADSLAKQTIAILTFELIPEKLSVLILALFEVMIGVFLIVNCKIKFIIRIAIIHLMLTFVPILFFPKISFVSAPFVLTLVGQYIVKNLVIICALFLIYPVDYCHKDKRGIID